MYITTSPASDTAPRLRKIHTIFLKEGKGGALHSLLTGSRKKKKKKKKRKRRSFIERIIIIIFFFNFIFGFATDSER